MMNMESNNDAMPNIYLPYKSSFYEENKNCLNSSNIMEASSLAHTSPPRLKYKLKMPKSIIETGILNSSQLDAVVLCCQKHEEILENGSRAGFLIGDSAGMGKGRVISGIILENQLSGRRRSIWVTQTSELFFDCARDFKNVSSLLNPVPIPASLNLEDYISVIVGTYLITYSTLSSKNNKRFEKVFEWFETNPDGLIIFDECHKAKGYDTTSIGQIVQYIQNKFPLARILYSSATSFYSPREMSYMTRLGLWTGQPFFTFQNFYKKIEERGLIALEILACELKANGHYLSRQISMKDVEVEILVIKDDECFTEIYNKSTELWMKLHEFLENATKQQHSTYWANHLNYFQTLITSSKISKCAEIALDEVYRKNNVVVFGLQKTGDSRFLSYVKEENELYGLFSVSDAILLHTFTSVFNFDVGKSSKSNCALTNTTRLAKTVPIPKDIKKIYFELKPYLPINPLNDLISKLGGIDKVAEMTGRKLRPSDFGPTATIDKKKNHASEKTSNMNERIKFQQGHKSFAIISDAASTGFSLHSCAVSSIPKRRIHFTLEYPWSAEKLIQQLGRTHRFNQSSAPKYIFPSSNIPGEQRFVWTIGQRLELMGASTQGDRKASKKSYITEKCVDSELGQKALQILIKNLSSNNGDLHDRAGGFFETIQDSMKRVGVIKNSEESDDFVPVKSFKVQKFLNRVLGIPLFLQKIIIDYFYSILENIIEETSNENKLSLGVLDYLVPENAVTKVLDYTDHKIYDKFVTLYEVEIDFGLSWEKLMNLAKNLKNPRFLTIKKEKTQIFFIFRENSDVFVYQPNDCRKIKFTQFASYHKDYSPSDKKRLSYDDKNAIEIWRSQYVNMNSLKCIHNYMKGSCSQHFCEEGARMKHFYIAAGQLSYIWEKITALVNYKDLSIVRLTTTDSHKILGILCKRREGEILLEKLNNF